MPTVDKETSVLFFEMLEDVTSYFCDEYDLSAEMAYVMTSAFAKTKIKRIKQLRKSFNA